jgi:hypothetical protein
VFLSNILFEELSKVIDNKINDKELDGATGEEIKIAAKTVVKFRLAKAAKDAGRPGDL